MYAARQLKRRGKLHSAWTDNCKMKVRIQQRGPTQLIKTMADLRELVGDEPELVTTDSSRPAQDAALGASQLEPRTPAETAPAQDAGGFRPVGTRSGSKRGRSSRRQ